MTRFEWSLLIAIFIMGYLGFSSIKTGLRGVRNKERPIIKGYGPRALLYYGIFTCGLTIWMIVEFINMMIFE